LWGNRVIPWIQVRLEKEKFRRAAGEVLQYRLLLITNEWRGLNG